MSRLASIVALATVVGSLFAACGGDDDAGRAPQTGRSEASGSTVPCSPPASIPAADAAALLPHGVTLAADATPIQATDADGTRTVVAHSSTSPRDAHEAYLRQVRDAGLEVTKTDDEGFEAEIFFRLSDGSTGVIQQRRARCPKGKTQTVISVATKDAGPASTVEDD